MRVLSATDQQNLVRRGVFSAHDVGGPSETMSIFDLLCALWFVDERRKIAEDGWFCEDRWQRQCSKVLPA